MIEMPKCSSCDRRIFPTEYSVTFKCPNCGIVTIVRCEKCRIFIHPYKCPNCGFEGP